MTRIDLRNRPLNRSDGMGAGISGNFKELLGLFPIAVDGHDSETLIDQLFPSEKIKDASIDWNVPRDADPFSAGQRDFDIHKEAAILIDRLESAQGKKQLAIPNKCAPYVKRV